MSLTKQQKRERVQYLKAITDAYAEGVTAEQLAKTVPTLITRFSMRNVCLILAQRPDAVECAGFHEWRKAGRKVRKGAKGIAILVPMKRSTEDDEGLWFSWRYVYDLADTEPVREAVTA